MLVCAAAMVVGLGPNVWLGPEYWANAMQDWRRVGERIECVEARPNFPMRTVHRLDTFAGSEQVSYSVSVVIDPKVDADWKDGAFAGILIGAGGEEVDYRISAQVHHHGAEDGGIAIVVDHEGRLDIRDNSVNKVGGATWSLGGALQEGEMPSIATEGLDTFDNAPREPFRITIEVTPNNERYYTVSASAATVGDDRGIGGCIAVVEPHQVDGNIALVSTYGPQGSDEGFAFTDWTIEGDKIRTDSSRHFGPIFGVQYSVHDGKLKLTAQGPPVDGAPRAQLHRFDGSEWRQVDSAALDDHAFTWRLQHQGIDTQRENRYMVTTRLSGGSAQSYLVVVPREPQDELSAAVLTCAKAFTGNLAWNGSSIWFPHEDVYEGVRTRNPDLLVFNGDQIYEGDLTPARRQNDQGVTLDYIYKFLRFYWGFGELTRNRPTVMFPDDHDVYHGNIWGAGGRQARARDGMTAQDSGGYTMPVEFVNAVHMTQTSHLPEPYDPAPIGMGVSVYSTWLDWGPASFLIFADRQWKESPTVAAPAGKFVNGWPQVEPITPEALAAPDAPLLGEMQERMIQDWAGVNKLHKVALSQTLFVNLATLPEGETSGNVIPSLPFLAKGEYPDNYALAHDADSNGWPKTARDRAVRLLDLAGVKLHLSGDQHLASTVKYEGGPFAFCVPAIANTWPRRWFPPGGSATGAFTDGFGNRFEVLAVANPYRTELEPSALHDRVPGFGFVRFRADGSIDIECWNRHGAGDRQYDGWPVHIP